MSEPRPCISFPPSAVLHAGRAGIYITVIFVVLLPSFIYSQGRPALPSSVKPGCDVLLTDSLHLLRHRRVGLLCNHTTRLSNGVFLFDTLRRISDVTLVAVFTPEHGFRGSADAGEEVRSGEVEGIPLYSLYGDTRRPTPAMLADIDILILDLQDIGARYYTFVTTMMYCLEAAAESDIPVLLLDRPNPIGGVAIEGPVREEGQKSFVSYLPTPVRHGMTAGELARMAIGEGWLRGAAQPRLNVIPLRGWRRDMYYDETGLPWVRPSPNINSLDAALAYVGTCLLEGSNISEGRGTDAPFLLFGAPFIDGDTLASALNEQGLPGVSFQSVPFVPAPRAGATQPRYAGMTCGGVRLEITDRRAFSAWYCGVEILRILRRLYDEKTTCTSYLSLLTGTDSFCAHLSSLNETAWYDEVSQFSSARMPYLLYR